MKLAVIGLGPAGLAIAHRASVRGWQVAGWDPQPPPTHVLSVFADELPHWAASLPEQSVSSPVVYTHDRQRICLNRDYLVLDNPRVWKALTTFPVHREAVDADSVTAEDLGADIVIDARGTRDLFPAERQSRLRLIVTSGVITRQCSWTSAQMNRIISLHGAAGKRRLPPAGHHPCHANSQ